MKCPVCSDKVLAKRELEPGLPCHSCITCNGAWIRPDTYGRWLDEHGLSGNQTSKTDRDSLEKRGLKFCPGCSHAMIKYKVGNGFDFSLDRCGKCYSVWFDGNEWMLLQASSLSSNIYAVFTDNYQRQIRLAEREESIESMWRARLGGKDYAEMKKLIAWISDHDKSEDLLAFQFSAMNLKR